MVQKRIPSLTNDSEIEEGYEKMAEGWPRKLKSALHEDELDLTKRPLFNCDSCGEEGLIWSYYCEDCDLICIPDVLLIVIRRRRGK